jgi:hypothetical protein
MEGIYAEIRTCAQVPHFEPPDEIVLLKPLVDTGSET